MKTEIKLNRRADLILGFLYTLEALGHPTHYSGDAA